MMFPGRWTKGACCSDMIWTDSWLLFWLGWLGGGRDCCGLASLHTHTHTQGSVISNMLFTSAWEGSIVLFIATFSFHWKSACCHKQIFSVCEHRLLITTYKAHRALAQVGSITTMVCPIHPFFPGMLTFRQIMQKIKHHLIEHLGPGLKCLICYNVVIAGPCERM